MSKAREWWAVQQWTGYSFYLNEKDAKYEAKLHDTDVTHVREVTPGSITITREELLKSFECAYFQFHPNEIEARTAAKLMVQWYFGEVKE